MPWRRTKDPYAIWVSEVMLQQTQVSVVIPYFEKWMDRFPSVGSLASASEEDVLQLWQGLGYYRRAKGLREGAKYIVEQGFPESAVDWLKVPGVGAYTARAISSIAQDLPVPLVDGNVERVYARLTGDASPRPSLTKQAWLWAEANVATESPGDWNQALMELGATVCTPRDPRCTGCPLRLECRAFLKGLTSDLPTPPTKTEPKRISKTFWIMISNEMVHLIQSPAGDWWSGMNILPSGDDSPAEGWIEDLGRIRFSVTNHRVTAEVKLIRLQNAIPGYQAVSINALDSVPIPAPHRKAISLLHKI